MAAPGVERVVLRAAVGDENYADVEQIAEKLDALEARGVISESGLALIIAALADEIVTQRVLREYGPLSFGDCVRDTSTPEDPST